jgi:hypothetical protein
MLVMSFFILFQFALLYKGMIRGFCFRKNLKRLHRLFKKKKKTGDHQIQEQYNNLKHHTQKITRQAYWKYIENVVTPDET